MRRRDFTKGIVGSGLAWPLAARARDTPTYKNFLPSNDNGTRENTMTRTSTVRIVSGALAVLAFSANVASAANLTHITTTPNVKIQAPKTGGTSVTAGQITDEHFPAKGGTLTSGGPGAPGPLVKGKTYPHHP
jgi:hypothetical protein